ncbi:hypothetical protein BHE74_00004437 [Ensete ventricosum]|nr:hypothetical protein BHE74_00004437 [Ensete ventricosum]
MEIQPDESHALKGTFASTKLQKDLWWTSSLDTLREMQSSGTIGSSTHMAYPYGGRSDIPVFQIWMEKMKEVKRPPL